MPAGYWNTERKSFAITVGGLLIAGAAGWTHFNDRLDDLDKRIGEIAANPAEDRCTQIMSRRIIAIEKGDKTVTARLEALSREQGCIREYGVEAYAATRPMTEAEKAEAKRQERAKQAAFETTIIEIDNRLGTFPPKRSLEYLLAHPNAKH